MTSPSSPGSAPQLELKFGGRLVEQLGAQMYPSATATVAELISNAWDADARNVWVEMPFGDWQHGEIIVTDDGDGMDLAEAQLAYLVVGRNRRAGGKQRTVGRNRLVHGRKGIGKLAAFGTATILELKSRKASGDEIAFRLDYDHIRKQEPNIPYRVEASEDTGPLADPVTGEPLSHGTRIKLSGLKLKRRLNPDQFTTSMSRRFALDEHEMAVFINGDRLRRYDIDLQFRFPPDRLPPEAVAEGEWAREELSGDRVVRWWIGFTPKPLQDDAQQGISVIVRGKLAQRPFKFEAGGGTHAQLGQEYLVGEVQADWIDDERGDATADDDLIQSNRDQLQIEDDDLAEFLEWGRRRLRWALAARDELRRERQRKQLEKNEALDRLLRRKPKRERDALTRVAAAVARLPEAGDDEVVRVMQAVLEAREDETMRALAHDIALAAGDADELFPLIAELAVLDARTALTLIDARLEGLAQLEALDPGDALPRAVELAALSPGLLDPSWNLYRTTQATSAHHPEGVHVLRLDSVVNGAAGVTMVVIAPSVPRGDSTDAVARERADEAERGVVVVSAEPGAVDGSVSWSELVRASIDRHSAWRSLISDKLARDQQ